MNARFRERGVSGHAPVLAPRLREPQRPLAAQTMPLRLRDRAGVGGVQVQAKWVHGSCPTLTFQWVRAKFFWICSLTEPRMSLSKAASPEILGGGQGSVGSGGSLRVWTLLLVPGQLDRSPTHQRCCKACWHVNLFWGSRSRRCRIKSLAGTGRPGQPNPSSPPGHSLLPSLSSGPASSSPDSEMSSQKGESNS